MIEQLTADERKHVAWANDRVWLKALRIIDAREQQAKALVSALEEAVKKTDDELKSIQLAQAIIGAHNELVAKHAADRAALVTQVAELTRERDEADTLAEDRHNETLAALARAETAESEVTRLTQTLAMTENTLVKVGEISDLHKSRAEAAEARVRELTERVSQAVRGLPSDASIRAEIEEILRAP